MSSMENHWQVLALMYQDRAEKAENIIATTLSMVEADKFEHCCSGFVVVHAEDVIDFLKGETVEH